MATWQQVRDAMQAEWATVSGVGDVYNYRRYMTTGPEAKAAMVNTIGGKEQIAFADIDLQTGSTTIVGWGDVNPAAWDVQGTAAVMGRVLRSQRDADASGATFGVLLWNLLLATTKAVGRITGDPSVAARCGAEITVNDLREFGLPGIGGAVCHYGEIVVRVPVQVEV